MIVSCDFLLHLCASAVLVLTLENATLAVVCWLCVIRCATVLCSAVGFHLVLLYFRSAQHWLLVVRCTFLLRPRVAFLPCLFCTCWKCIVHLFVLNCKFPFKPVCWSLLLFLGLHSAVHFFFVPHALSFLFVRCVVCIYADSPRYTTFFSQVWGWRCGDGSPPLFMENFSKP